MNKQLPKIAIILVNWNGCKDTLECLASLQKINYSNTQIVVVDNGSTNDSVQQIRRAFPDIPLIESKENLGFAGGNNLAIDWVLQKRAEWIFLLNNDTVADPEVLNEFLASAKEQPRAKIFGAKIFLYNDPERIDHCGGFWNPKKGEFESHSKGELDHPYFDMQPVDYVCGAALFMHRSVPEKIGLLETRFFLFWEENDYCYRARLAGFEVWTSPKAKIWHKVSASFSGGKPHMHYFWWRSRLLWIERNTSQKEKKELYRNIIVPEAIKMLRNFLLKSAIQFCAPKPSRLEKIRRYKAGCVGILHFLKSKFGNCPNWLRSDISKSGTKKNV